MTYAIQANGTIQTATNDRREANRLAAEWSTRSGNGVASVYCRRAKMTIARARNGRIESECGGVVRQSNRML